MKGFSEQGQPDDWNMALGSVRGYRWWILSVPFERADCSYRVAGASFRDYGRYMDISDGIPSPLGRRLTGFERWLPDMRQARVTGMHGSSWDRNVADSEGWYTADCVQIGNKPPRHQEVPSPGCGCGFWAYWHDLSADWDACRPYIRSSSPSLLDVMVPVGGVVEGSGRTIIGERGFRSEKVRITDLSFNIRGANTIFQDESRYDDTSFGAMWGTPAVSPSWTVMPVPSPVEVGPFLPYLERRTELPQGTLMQIFGTALWNILGSGFRWHDSTGRLRENCKPDENYGNRSW